MSIRAVTNASLCDGTTAPPRPGYTVVWGGSGITWVGPDDGADLEGIEAFDAAGGAVVPGLIDAHVHLCFEPTIEGTDAVATDPIEVVRDRSMAAAGALLDAGITSARDQGSRDGVAIEVARAQRDGRITGARILAAGRGITPTGGHGWMIGVEADGPDAVRRAVATEIERGAEIIKLFPTGGVLGSGAHGYALVMSPAEVAAAAAEAHRLGVLVGAHIHGPEGIDVALEAGVDTIEHATAITTEQAERAAAAGVALVPTLTAIDVILARGDALPPDLSERATHVRQEQAAGIARAIAAGARVLAGTDAGTPFNPPGELVREMKALAGLGLGNLGALAAATSLAAETLRMTGRGLLEPGKRADLLVVDGDPAADLTALETPRLVVQDGAVVH